MSVTSSQGATARLFRRPKTVGTMMAMLALGSVASACSSGSTSTGVAATSATTTNSATTASSATTATATTAGTITFGADFTEPPGQLLSNGKMTGSDYQLCNALAKQMNMTAKWVDISFGTLISALGAKRVDAVCSSMDVTPARQAVVSFVEYRSDSEGAAVQSGNPKHVTGPSDLCGLNAAELLGSVYQTRVQQASSLCQQNGKAPINLKTFPTVADAFAQIVNGRADVVIGDAPIMAYYVSQHPSNASLAFQGVSPTPVGIALRKSETSLQAQLQSALTTLQQNGTYLKILTSWNLQSGALK